MKIHKFVFFAVLCTAMSIVANGPVGDIIFNNDTGWNLSIKSKVKNSSTLKEITMIPDQGGTVLPLENLESLTIEAVPSMFTFSKKPTSNDGRKILSAIDNNKARLTGKDTVEVNLDIKDNAIDAGIKISGPAGFLSLPETSLPYDLLLDESYVKQKIGNTNYDAFVVRIPEKYRMRIVQQAVDHLANDENKNAKKLSEQELFGLLQKFFSEKQHNKTPLHLIGKAYGVHTSAGSYNVFQDDSLMRGNRLENNMTWYAFNQKPLLKYYENLMNKNDKQEAQSLIPVMFGNYKIHLMPLEKDLLEVTIKLLDAIRDNPVLRDTISDFKIADNGLPYKQAAANDHSGQNAVVVIYPADGKEKAQKALNELYKVFKGTKGMNVRPRFNAKVNDFMWVAQGDADLKYGFWEHFYDKDGIYYKPEEFGKPANMDLKLKHPETGKDLVDIK